MGWLEPMAALLVIAAAVAGGFWASVVLQRRQSRARGPFLAGVFCGVMVGVVLAGRRRLLNTIGASLVRRAPALSIGDFGKYCLTTASRIVRSIARDSA